ncbi:RDD family protein [Actinomadura viridis]|uniref:RDD family membrane protein YckC n=1 Tax=Actinomadura viridis TaxID=58110 RepID=A0A931GLU8_9ACTN|nr:RDD family protein [Actinomadura viridis]MBG6091922.1 putative RDD family membrane protein YckC [Actinomadura viridis]
MKTTPASTGPLYVPAGTPRSPVPGDRTVRVAASTRRRVIARLLDMLVTLILFMTAMTPAYAFIFLAPDASPGKGMIATIASFWLAMAVWIALRVRLVARWGCTVGQRVAGIRVVRYEDGISPPDRKQARKRRFGSYDEGGRMTQVFWPFSDVWIHIRDKELGRCGHDLNVGTIVVLAQAPPPKTGDGAPSAPASGPHAQIWERRERIRRGLLAALLAVLAVVPFAFIYTVSRPDTDEPVRKPEAAFEADTFYPDEPRFENQLGDRPVAYTRTASRVLNSAAGCLAGAAGSRAREVLERARCEGRIEIAFRTADGVLVSGHVLRFPDEAAAATVERDLPHTGLRFVPGGPIRNPGGASIGQVGHRKRYVVATTAASPEQKDVERKVKDAFMLIHAPALNVIIWS